MGGAASTLTAEQTAELTAKLKTAYETCNADNLEDEIIQSTMQCEYRELIEKFKPEVKIPKIIRQGSDLAKLTEIAASRTPVTPATPATSSTPKEDVKVSARQQAKDNAAAKDASVAAAKAKPTRRRSFDPSGMKKTVEGTSVADALKKAQEVSQSAAQLPSLPVVLEVVDSWDSVSTQPFCTVCQMAFKSMAFLERHTKYSDLHTKNAAKQGGAAMVSVAPKMEVVAPIAEDSSVSVSASGHSTSLAAKFLSKQVEGTDYKLLYTGSKFFWRNQRTVILDLYLHMVSLTIEVIAFDSDKHKEMNRLYLAADVISDLMDVAIVEEFEAKLKELHSNDRFAEVDEDKLKEELKLTRSISYIISRIQLGFGAGKSNTAIIVEFTKMSGDNYELRSPILEEPPLVLMPVGITRRRRTNAQEIEAKISSLSLDYKSISKDVDRAKNLSKDGLGLVHKAGSAERISNHVYNAVSYFAKKKWWTAAEVTPLRRKWVRAIRRVVLQRLVAITKTHLILKNIPFVSGAAAEAVGGQSPTRRGTRLSIRVRATEV